MSPSLTGTIIMKPCTCRQQGQEGMRGCSKKIGMQAADGGIRQPACPRAASNKPPLAGQPYSKGAVARGTRMELRHMAAAAKVCRADS